VGKIAREDIDDETLHAALREARTGGLRLVYFSTSEERHMASALLCEFAGQRVDTKVTFVTDLPTSFAGKGIDQPKSVWSPLSVTEYPPSPASDKLVALSIAAGVHSRFNVDRRIPKDKYEQLYATWIRRSALREIADVVLTAAGPETGVIGMITIGVSGTAGCIGLIAVDERWRGQGVGVRLICSAHDWMTARELTSASVVTQRDNQSACRLYRRCGYRLAQVRSVYHFWVE
jgi:dTDP-4-amino-4,6-dideoxy-D-galactose acyltransferase